MDTKELNDNWNAPRDEFSQKLAILNDNNLMMDEDSKYEMFRKIRMKLGKTKEEFHKIFELYNHLSNQ